jgi:hypothetical protein
MNTSHPPVSQAAAKPQELARDVAQNPRLLEEVMRGLDAKTARVKHGCAKALRALSETRPGLLYPKFDFFVRLLDHPNKIYQWEAARVLAQLARVDEEDKFAAIFDKYFAPIRGPVMITAATLIQGGARIAAAKPQLADRIAAEVIKVERARYQTPACRNVAIGHAIAALDDLFARLRNPAPALRFVRKQARNSRPATRKKAEKFLKGVGKRAKGPTAQRRGPGG